MGPTNVAMTFHSKRQSSNLLPLWIFTSPKAESSKLQSSEHWQQSNDEPLGRVLRRPQTVQTLREVCREPGSLSRSVLELGNQRPLCVLRLGLLYEPRDKRLEVGLAHLAFTERFAVAAANGDLVGQQKVTPFVFFHQTRDTSSWLTDRSVWALAFRVNREPPLFTEQFTTHVRGRAVLRLAA